MYSSKKFFKKFEDGITEVRRIFPPVELYAGKDGEQISERDVIQNMMTKVFERYPVLEDPEFKSVPSFLIKHSRVSIRIGNFYSLDWFVIRPRRQREGAAPIEIGYDFVVTIYNSVETSAEVKFRNEGWEQTALPADQLYSSLFRQRNRRIPAITNEEKETNERSRENLKRYYDNEVRKHIKEEREKRRASGIIEVRVDNVESKEDDYPTKSNSRWDKNSKNYRGFKEERTRSKFDDDNEEFKPNNPLVSKAEDDDEEENKILAMTEKIDVSEDTNIATEEDVVEAMINNDSSEIKEEPEEEVESKPVSSPMLDSL